MTLARLLSTAALALLASAATLTSAQAADGATVYKQNCLMCHDAGLANSPKFGDKAAWEPRIKAAGSRDGLLAHALKGKGVMPPKGGNPALSDSDVGAALDHMLAAVK
ncbi:MAG: cytochrome c5 family protein [Leptothrix sp. (in: b-proteobacteria)]